MPKSKTIINFADFVQGRSPEVSQCIRKIITIFIFKKIRNEMLSPPLPSSCRCSNKMMKTSKVKTSDFSEPDFSQFLDSIEIAPRRRRNRKNSNTPLRKKVFHFDEESSIPNSEISSINDSIFKANNDTNLTENFGNLFNYFNEDIEVLSSDKEIYSKVRGSKKQADEQKNRQEVPPKRPMSLEKKFNAEAVEMPEKPKRIFNSTMNSSFAPLPETDQSFASVKDKISFFNSIQRIKRSSKCKCSSKNRKQCKSQDESSNASVREKIQFFNKINHTYKNVSGRMGCKKNLRSRPHSKNLEEIVGENFNNGKDQKFQAVEVSLNLLEFCINQWKSELEQEEHEENSEEVLEETTFSHDIPEIKNNVEPQQTRHSSIGEYASQQILVECQINTPPHELKEDSAKKLMVTDLDEVESEKCSQVNIYERVHSTEGNSDSGNYSSCRNISRRLNFDRSSKRISVASYSSSGSSNKPTFGGNNSRRFLPTPKNRFSHISTQTDAGGYLPPSPITSTPEKTSKNMTIENSPMEFKTASEDFMEQYMPRITPETKKSSKKTLQNKSSFKASIKSLDEVKHLLENFKVRPDQQASKSNESEEKKKSTKKSKIASSLMRLVRYVFGKSKTGKSKAA